MTTALRAPRRVGFFASVAVVCAVLLPTPHQNLISVTAVVAIVALPITWKFASRVGRRFTGLALLYCLALTMADVYSGRFDGYVGTILIALALSATIILVERLAEGDPKRIIGLALVCLGATAAFNVLFTPGDVALDVWKYGVGLPVTLGIVGLSCYKWTSPFAAYVVLAVMALVNISLGYRNLAGTCLFAAIWLFMARYRPRSRPVASFAFRLAVVGAALAVALSFYGQMAAQGSLGEQQRDKYLNETRAGGSSALLIARPEFFASLSAIMQSPLLGNGSRPQAEAATIERAKEMAAAAGAPLPDSEQDRIWGSGEALNSHSMLFGGWVVAGLAGLLMWGFFLKRALTVLGHVGARIGGVGAALVTLWSFQLCWDLLFSPWAPHFEVLLAVYFVLTEVLLLQGPATANQVSEATNKVGAR